MNGKLVRHNTNLLHNIFYFDTLYRLISWDP